ncbi:MAG: D-glycero-beta-D-manno-heptose-7-phosphate kinase [Rhodospirillales bacterium]
MLDWGDLPVSILVVGDLMLDRYLMGTCERISPEAPVQVVDVHESRSLLGGAGNVVRNIIALGARAHLVSVIGDDIVGDEVEQLLRDCGAGAAGVLRDKRRRTTEKTRLFAINQQIVRYDREVRDTLEKGIEAALIDQVQGPGAVDAIVISDYGKGVLSERVCRETIAWARSRRIPVLCDPKGRTYDKYAGATIVTPNKKEASEATGIQIADRDSLHAAGALLRERFDLEHCLITLSEDGMALFSADGVHRYTSRAREVFDVTGAGDTAMAALAVGLASGRPAVEACRIANVAAGIKVGKLGAATVTLAEVNDELYGSRHHAACTEKIVSKERLAAIAAEKRLNGQAVVFTNGCFDILHRGHAEYLQRAAEMGDCLVVAINSDQSVRKLKGPGRPILAEDDRAYMLAALACVDHVVIFDEETPYELIAAVSPTVLVKGGDYAPDEIVGADIVRSRGGVVRTVALVEGRSTTRIVQDLRCRELS